MKTILEHVKNKTPVESIWLQTTEGGYLEKSLSFQKLELQEDYLGDRSEIWVILSDMEGNEIRRYNLRFVATINWKR